MERAADDMDEEEQEKEPSDSEEHARSSVASEFVPFN
jgi:hypothetical protein